MKKWTPQVLIPRDDANFGVLFETNALRPSTHLGKSSTLITFDSSFPSGLTRIQSTETCYTEKSPTISAQSFGKSRAEHFLSFNYLGQENLQKVKKPNCVNSMLAREQCKVARKLCLLP